MRVANQTVQIGPAYVGGPASLLRRDKLERRVEIGATARVDTLQGCWLHCPEPGIHQTFTSCGPLEGPRWYDYYGGLADKVEGAVIPIDKPALNYTRHEPLGVVVAITPWNSPLLLASWKLAPALAAGNTVVLKPSEFTSVSALEFVKLVDEAGFPPGVVNVVTGYGREVGEALVSHPLVAKVAFTGGEATGQHVYEEAARGLKRVSLELGGKSPNVVFDDAVIDDALKGVISGIFAATGQTCIAGSRLLVQRSIHDAFVDRLVDFARGARLGACPSGSRPARSG